VRVTIRSDTVVVGPKARWREFAPSAANRKSCTPDGSTPVNCSIRRRRFVAGKSRATAAGSKLRNPLETGFQRFIVQAYFVSLYLVTCWRAHCGACSLRLAKRAEFVSLSSGRGSVRGCEHRVQIPSRDQEGAVLSSFPTACTSACATKLLHATCWGLPHARIRKDVFGRAKR